MFPNGSITDAVTNPSPRSVRSSCSLAPMDSSFSSAASMSSTCQFATAPAGPPAEPWGAYSRVDQTQLVLVVTHPELHVREPAVRPEPFEVRLHAQQLGVPPPCRRHVIGKEDELAESSQHGCAPFALESHTVNAGVCHGQAYHGGDRVRSRPCDVPGRPAFANSVILGVGPRILEARSRTK